MTPTNDNHDNPTHVFDHTGWHLDGDQAIYLHHGGALGPSGPVAGLRARLSGRLSRFALPDPPDGDELQAAVRASLDMLGVASAPVSVALLAMVYRAPLGYADFSGFLVGPSDAGKTALAALAQQYYGATIDGWHLPADGTSTSRPLEVAAHQVKDALVVIDNVAFTGNATGAHWYNASAARLLRAQGNGSGRGRMRGLPLATGTHLPGSASLRARLLVMEIGTADVNWAPVHRLREQAASGTLAAAMAGYLRWLAPDHCGDAERVAARVDELRPLVGTADAHPRTRGMIANLAIGLERFLQFARDVGAIDAGERRALWQRGWRALLELGQAQALRDTGGAAA